MKTSTRTSFRTEAGYERVHQLRLVGFDGPQSPSQLCRLGMKHPPTAVGGISTFEAKPRWVIGGGVGYHAIRNERTKLDLLGERSNDHFVHGFLKRLGR